MFVRKISDDHKITLKVLQKPSLLRSEGMLAWPDLCLVMHGAMLLAGSHVAITTWI